MNPSKHANSGCKKQVLWTPHASRNSVWSPATLARQSEENGSKNFRPMADSDGQFFQTIKTIFSDPTKTTLFAPWRTSMPINSAVYTYQQCGLHFPMQCTEFVSTLQCKEFVMNIYSVDDRKWLQEKIKWILELAQIRLWILTGRFHYDIRRDISTQASREMLARCVFEVHVNNPLWGLVGLRRVVSNIGRTSHFLIIPRAPKGSTLIAL